MFIIISRRTRELERGNHHSERPAILQLNFLDRKGQPETGCPFLLLSLSRDNVISLYEFFLFAIAKIHHLLELHSVGSTSSANNH